MKIPELDEIRLKLQQIEEKDRKADEARQAAKAKQEQDDIIHAAYKEINDFAQSKDQSGNLKHPEFAISRPYEEMNRVYEGFGADVARILYQRDPRT